MRSRPSQRAHHPGSESKVVTARLGPVGLAALATALALGACGGGEASGKQDKVAEAIEEAFTGTDPESCKVFSSNFFEQVSGEGSAAERKKCEQGSEDGGSYASSVDVSDVQVGANRARARVKIQGGQLDAQGLTLALVKREAGWRIDAIRAVNVNREKFFESYLEPQQEELRRVGFTRAQADCILDELRKASDSQLEDILVKKEPPILAAAAMACA